MSFLDRYFWKHLEAKPIDLFLFSARWGFGSWLLYLGLSKWLGGASGFVSDIESTFAETWLPEPLVLVTAWAILVSEVVIATLLLVGFKPRLTWIAATKLMFFLMLGQTIIAQYAVVANNWQYTVFCLLCACLSEPVSKSALTSEPS